MKTRTLAALVLILGLAGTMAAGCRTVGHREVTVETPFGTFRVSDHAYPDSTGKMESLQTLDDTGKSLVEKIIGQTGGADGEAKAGAAEGNGEAEGAGGAGG